MDNHNKELSATLYIDKRGRLTDRGLDKEIYITGMDCITPTPLLMHNTYNRQKLYEGYYMTKGIVFCVNVELIFNQ